MTELPDQSEREQVLDLQHSFIVQAPAGSGKTELLIQRYLALLSQASTPESIIAITFTRKAAYEMKERVLQALRLTQQPVDELSEPQKTRAKLAKRLYHWQLERKWNLLEQPHRLHIQTIDAFYAELIRKASFSSHFKASFPIAEHPETLYKIAIRHMLTYLEDNSPLGFAIGQLARHLNNDTLQIERLLTDMLAHRDQWLSIVESGIKNADQLRSMLEKHLHILKKEHYQNIQKAFLQFCTPNSIVMLQNWLQFNTSEKAHLLYPSCEEFWLRIIATFMTQQGQWRQKIIAQKNILDLLTTVQKQQYQQCKKEIQQILNILRHHESFRVQLWNLKQFPLYGYTEAQWSLLKNLFHVLSALLQILDFTFQTYKKSDYIAVALKALDVLGTDEDPTETLLKYDAYIQHILIDELQDISMAQLQFFTKLTAGWQAHDGRTLFLVGDPMQSIYQFRNAEPGIFHLIQAQGIGNCILKSLKLSANFRATAPLVNWINHHFSAINKNLYLQYHQSNTLTPSVAIPTMPALEISDCAVTTHWFDTLSPEEEAERIVDLVQNILKTNTTIQPVQKQPNIGILARSRQHLIPIVAKLKLTDIPYLAIEIETLFDQPIIQDLLALARALAHPGDEIAWLAIVRAPWCGISLKSLDYLMQACRSTQPTSIIWEQLCHFETMDLEHDDKVRLKRLVQTLQPIMQSSGRLPLYQRVKQAWINLGGLAMQSTLIHHTLADVDTFFRCLNQVQIGQTLVDSTLLEKALKNEYIKTKNNTGDVKVILMTIHKAKGLEFDVVILPSLHKAVRNENYPLILFDKQRSHNENCLIIAPIKASESATQEAIYQYLWNMQAKYYQMERIRLFYVACTRAKYHLHLIGELKVASSKKALPPGSFLYWLWPILSLPINITPTEINSVKVPTALPVLRKMSLKSLYPIASPVNTLHVRQIRHLKKAYHTSLTSHNLIENIICKLFYYIAERRLSFEALLQEATQIKRYRVIIEDLLRTIGRRDAFHNIVDVIMRVLKSTLSSAKGRWILMGTHLYQDNNYAFYRFEKSKIFSTCIKRIVLDTHNRLWLIDYRFDYPAYSKQFSVKQHVSLEVYQNLLEQAQALHQLQHVKLSYQSMHAGLYWPDAAQWLEEELTIT